MHKCNVEATANVDVLAEIVRLREDRVEQLAACKGLWDDLREVHATMLAVLRGTRLGELEFKPGKGSLALAFPVFLGSHYSKDHFIYNERSMTEHVAAYYNDKISALAQKLL